MNRRSLSIMLALALVASAFVAALGTASADHVGDDPVGHAYLPWVPNGAVLGDQGPFYGTVTVQNIENLETDVQIYIGAGTSSTNWDLAETIRLNPNESMTLSADALEIPADGASVVIYGWRVHDGDDDIPARIAAVAKNVGPTASGDGTTSASHVTVDGYSALTYEQVRSGDNQFVLPIVQTNDGWDTTVRVANLNESGTGLSNVSVALYEAGGQGFGGESAVVNLQIRPGGVGSFTMSDYVEAGWVGSAFITSSANIGAVAERHKSNNEMLLTNVSRPLAQSWQTTQFAPLVFKEYNFWNTGISVANTSQSDWNQVTVTYYGPTSNVVGQDTLTIPPRGMEFVYRPGGQSLGLLDGFVGSAKLVGTQPFHASVDQVKYFGDDPDVGQAMSYIVEADPAGAGDNLVLPLAQKGNPATGGGDTSGIQLFNGNPGGAATIHTVFYSAAGIPVAPTVTPAGNPAPIAIDLAAHQSYTLYTHNLSELSSGYQGSVIINVVAGENVTAVSNNVNYDVQNDGSAAFNLVRVEPRVGNLLTIDPETETNLLGEDHTVTVTLVDQFGHPMDGETIDLLVEHDDPNFDAAFDGETDANGEVEFTWSRTDGAALGGEVITASHVDAGIATATKTWDAVLELFHVLEDDDVINGEVINGFTLLQENGDDYALNPTGEDHTVLAIVTDVNGFPVENAVVEFNVDSDAGNPDPDSGQVATDGDGVATFTYSNDTASIDTITANLAATGTEADRDLTKEWQDPAAGTIVLSAGEQFTTESDPATNWAAFEFEALVTDQFGEPMPGEPVDFALLTGGSQFWDEDAFTGFGGGDDNGLRGGSFTSNTDGVGVATAIVVSFGEPTPLLATVEAESGGVVSNQENVEFNY